MTTITTVDRARAYRDFIKWKLRQYGPGRKHSYKKKARLLRESYTKWDHSDINYGWRLAMATVRIAQLKREAV